MITWLIDAATAVLQADKPRDLKSYLSQTKKVCIKGVVFEIRMINIVDHLEGAKVLQELYSVYKTKDERAKQLKQDAQAIKKSRIFIKDILMAGVVSPPLARKSVDESDNNVAVDSVLEDWALSQELAKHILDYTYSKKKIRRSPRPSYRGKS